MIDIKLLRQDPDAFIRAAQLKNCPVDIPALLEIDRELGEITRRHQEARQRRQYRRAPRHHESPPGPAARRRRRVA